jgi:molybdopterin synthase catalytic subunit
VIRIQSEDFNIGQEIDALTADDKGIGGICTFTGTVRDMGGDKAVTAMTLEHYPGMTEKALQEIEAEACARWPVSASLVIHRYGRLGPGDRIVLVITASAHRQAAFDACQFLMDWLKTKAPFWKKEEAGDGAQWVDARESDDAATERWKNGE